MMKRPVRNIFSIKEKTWYIDMVSEMRYKPFVETHLASPAFLSNTLDTLGVKGIGGRPLPPIPI